MTQTNNKKFPSITDKLTLAAIPIGVVYIFIMVAVAIALYQAQSSQKSINYSLVPLVNDVKNIVTDVTFAAAYVPRIQYASNDEDLYELRSNIIPNLERVQANINKISVNSLVSLDASYIDELNKTLDKLEVNIEKLIALKQQSFQWQADFNQRVAHARNALEHSAISVETYINQSKVDRMDILTQDTFMQIQFNVERIARHLNAIEILSSTDLLLAEKSGLSLLFRETAELNIRTTEYSFMAGFAKDMEKVFANIMVENGAINRKRAILENFDDLTALSNKVLLSTNAISEKTVAIADGVGETIQLATEKSHLIITAVFITIPIAFIITITLTAFFIWQAVIKGIIKPLAQISHSTLALAEGDINTKIDSQNTAEFIALSKSLETFKSNSIQLINSENDLQKKNLSLKKANEDLNHFAYIASHDLKSPLRGIDNLAKFIEDDINHGNLDEIQTYLQKMHMRIARMNNLLDDLLEYSRIGPENSQRENIDCKKILLECFEIVNENQKITLNIGEIPKMITIHRTPFMLVMRNLFDNAIKHHDLAQGTVSINGIEEAKEYIFYIRDDGPGISQNYQERIFKIFHRLKSQDKVEGSGIGLSTVEKILHTYGGSISINSNPEKERGTEFTVRWPKPLIHSRPEGSLK